MFNFKWRKIKKENTKKQSVKQDVYTVNTNCGTMCPLYKGSLNTKRHFKDI